MPEHGRARVVFSGYIVLRVWSYALCLVSGEQEGVAHPWEMGIARECARYVSVLKGFLTIEAGHMTSGCVSATVSAREANCYVTCRCDV